MPVKLKPLNQQTIVITGASSGIGREFALQLAKKGFNIALVSRTPSQLDSVVKEICASQVSA